jgi:hypothetical protein
MRREAMELVMRFPRSSALLRRMLERRVAVFQWRSTVDLRVVPAKVPSGPGPDRFSGLPIDGIPKARSVEAGLGLPGCPEAVPVMGVETYGRDWTIFQ